MSRNANGEGSIYQWKRNGKPDGYKGALSYKDENGDTKRYVAYGRTRQQVRDKLDAARDRLKAGAPVKDANRTVADWLAHWRATTLAVSDRKDSTRALYATLCRKHLEPAPFGAITLDKLRPSDIEALVLALRDKGLSDSTIRTLYTILRGWPRRRRPRWADIPQCCRPRYTSRHRAPRSNALGRRQCRRGSESR